MEDKTVYRGDNGLQQVQVPSDEEVSKFNISTYVPLIASLLGLLNFFLVEILGMEPFPYTVQEVVNIISMILIVVGTVYGWWKNNDVTKEAKKRTNVADQVIPKDKK